MFLLRLRVGTFLGSPPELPSGGVCQFLLFVGLQLGHPGLCHSRGVLLRYVFMWPFLYKGTSHRANPDLVFSILYATILFLNKILF